MIQVNDLHKRFGSVVALDGVSFAASDGQVTGLLGPNGAGKTTTLRILYTVLRPDSGNASIDGCDVLTQMREAQARIGALPDSHGIYPRLTARENIRYYGRLHGLKGPDLEQRIDELIRLLEMDEIANRRSEGFSTGERVKVALGRALVHGARNLLLDEPTNGLDVMSTRAVRGLIRRLRDEGKTILFSSHIMPEVSALCDHVVVIAHGRVAASGTPEALRQAAGQATLEDAFAAIIGSEEGLQR
jgi:sodium transport system ATP-binding protein